MKNNILFFLTPKAMCAYLYDDFTIRQAIEKMETAGYNALPILSRNGEYRGSISEGDLLWAMKNMCYMDMRQAESRRIMEIDRRKNYLAVKVTTSMQDLIDRSTHQNFVPWWMIRTHSSASLPARPSFSIATTCFSRKPKIP